ncbi:MAG: o-succinylbenzoate synthase [Psychromonas sp.]|nr:o-succinylbenzoate synthase [Alteromonadales bacterium]MCP5079778.1 o-succinylbenzoate synthase [Psychromonas sp.]
MSPKQPPLFTQAKLFAYKLPFKVTMQFKQHQLYYREGLILQLIDNSGQLHYAEIAPLRGFSQETLTEVKQEVIELLSRGLENLTAHNNQLNSLQFALDSLSLTNKIDTNNQLVSVDTIPLLQGSSEQIQSLYKRLGQPDLIKLKVARASIKTDIDNFQTLCLLNPKLKIRCDANQAWNKQQASQFFSGINTLQLDYIEEPTSIHQTNLDLAEQHSIQLGLDETLQQPNFSFQDHRCISAFIIKPTIIGSKEKIDRLVSLAAKFAIKVSFSSSFETVVGLHTLEKLACLYQLQHIKQGLMVSLGTDTLKYFDSSLLQDIDKIEKDNQQLELLWTSN